MAAATLGRAAVRPAPIPIREGQTRQGRCCVSSSHVNCPGTARAIPALERARERNVVRQLIDRSELGHLARAHFAEWVVMARPLTADTVKKSFLADERNCSGPLMRF